jgi:CheY-like chemotaxis protein
MMGSELKVKSKEGEGSTFYFTLQLDHVKDIETSSSIPKMKEEVGFGRSNEILTTSGGPISNEILGNKNRGLQGGSILLAEDNEINQLIIQKLLKDAGFDVVIASNGRECIDAFEKNQNFDLIFMDIQMPEMDGIQATAYIRKVLKNDTVKIIALTADMMSGTREMVIQNGMNDYLTKPIKEEELLESCQRWIHKEPIN